MRLMLRQQLLLMIRALYFCMEEKWEKVGKQFNITPAQQHILFLLSTSEGELTPTEISQLGCWHNSTVTRLLKPLLEKELITITVDKDKPRFKYVSLLTKGEEVLLEIVNLVSEMKEFPCAVDHLSEEEISDFLEYGQSILKVHKGKEFTENVIGAQMKGHDYA
ncbi:MarR family winged helix-turn-helix transcriptional regulator [Bacillus sp. FJAT-45350]|uniref:MarR family winged helix-turn-helix transcriptional regulator n=1 Tax=Bacillus sp. FJAT-45350 TaxID=2011014 RepID=UPI000BB8FA01|nr:MarR family winged helix-turn-helix transcriptional regulator [Bacillus sp. FJAT-45350]